MTKRILFLTPYPQDTAGSQRFRFEQYLPEISERGYVFDCQSFIDQGTWRVLYKQGFLLKKLLGIISGYFRRFWMLTYLHRYDVIFVHREATPLGPPLIEWLIAKVWKKKMIYDFDDSIWLANTSAENILISRLKFPGKVNRIIAWSHKVSAGNQYLMDHASAFNRSVLINPTTIDTAFRHIPSPKNNELITIGWTGTHSTLKYLDQLREPLQIISRDKAFVLLVIADKPPAQALPNQLFVPWDKMTEIEDLNKIDIGVMPLEDNLWARGKCGFKALQFMALEIPVLVSPVGVNTDIVEHGKHGYHCVELGDWLEKLNSLIDDSSLRKEFGKAGRQKVEKHYSVQANTDNFFSLFD